MESVDSYHSHCSSSFYNKTDHIKLKLKEDSLNLKEYNLEGLNNLFPEVSGILGTLTLNYFYYFAFS